MKPEKQEAVDSDEEFIAIGVPKEWVASLKALGYTTIEKRKEVEKPGKLANELNGYKKKNWEKNKRSVKLRILSFH